MCEVQSKVPNYGKDPWAERLMIDDRYITETYDGGIRITMKVYKEWVDENGEAQVFHKTDTAGFKSPLTEKFEV